MLFGVLFGAGLTSFPIEALLILGGTVIGLFSVWMSRRSLSQPRVRIPTPTLVASGIRPQTEHIVQVEAGQTAQHLQFLSAASAALNGTLDLNSMLEAFANVVVAQFSDWCEIVLLAEDEFKVEDVVIAHHDLADAELAYLYRQTHSIGWDQPGGVGRVIRTGRPELYSEITQEIIDETSTHPARHAMLSQLGMRSGIVVPLMSNGKVAGAIFMIATRSERKYLPMDLSVAADLAKRLSLSIDNSRLFSKVQEASQAKSAFLAQLSHEIRTPLNAVLGFAELLSESELQPNQRQHLSTLLRNAQRLLGCANKILDLSNVESQILNIERSEFLLPALIAEVMRVMTVQAEEKKLEFHVSSPPDLPQRVISDPARIRQILFNIIGNALKFTIQGSIDVHIELHANEVQPASPLLEISVIDTGIGLTRNQRDRLFDPFVPPEIAAGRGFGGTGLGLFVARRLARLLGGDVVLGSSHPLKGSQFIVTVAIDLVEESKAAKFSNVGIEDGMRASVLVVDDADDTRHLIQQYLSRMGIDADTAASGDEGVRMALQKQYSLVLMDVKMPDMDGFAAIQKLRERNYGGPIVALTAYALNGDRERCLAGGFDGYLGKPIDRQMLKQSLLKFVVPHPALQV